MLEQYAPMGVAGLALLLIVAGNWSKIVAFVRTAIPTMPGTSNQLTKAVGHYEALKVYCARKPKARDILGTLWDHLDDADEGGVA